MMTLEQIGQLAVLWYEAELDWERRINAVPEQPHVRARYLMDRWQRSFRAAIRDYKLLQGRQAHDRQARPVRGRLHGDGD